MKISSSYSNFYPPIRNVMYLRYSSSPSRDVGFKTSEISKLVISLHPDALVPLPSPFPPRRLPTISSSTSHPSQPEHFHVVPFPSHLGLGRALIAFFDSDTFGWCWIFRAPVRPNPHVGILLRRTLLRRHVAYFVCWLGGRRMVRWAGVMNPLAPPIFLGIR